MIWIHFVNLSEGEVHIPLSSTHIVVLPRTNDTVLIGVDWTSAETREWYESKEISRLRSEKAWASSVLIWLYYKKPAQLIYTSRQQHLEDVARSVNRHI
jgi:hypothetical protein